MLIMQDKRQTNINADFYNENDKRTAIMCNQNTNEFRIKISALKGRMKITHSSNL